MTAEQLETFHTHCWHDRLQPLHTRSKGINSNLILWHNVWSCYGAKPDKLETKNVDGAYKEFRCPTFDHLEYLC